jgi:hypothetical protein
MPEARPPLSKVSASHTTEPRPVCVGVTVLAAEEEADADCEEAAVPLAVEAAVALEVATAEVEGVEAAVALVVDVAAEVPVDVGVMEVLLVPVWLLLAVCEELPVPVWLRVSEGVAGGEAVTVLVGEGTSICAEPTFSAAAMSTGLTLVTLAYVSMKPEELRLSRRGLEPPTVPTASALSREVTMSSALSCCAADAPSGAVPASTGTAMRTVTGEELPRRRACPAEAWRR